MLEYMVKRFVQMIVVLLVVSTLVFMLTNFIGDPVDMLVPGNVTMEQVESARTRLGPDKPLPVQYTTFLKDVLHGNFGKSYTYGKPAMGPILECMPATMELVTIATLLVLMIAIPLSAYAGVHPKRASNKVIISDSILGIPLPFFWVGMMMIYIFAVTLGKLSASGKGGMVDVPGVNLSILAPGGIRFIILPVTILATISMIATLYLTRFGILENTRQDYIKFARAEGVPSRALLSRYALRDALIPMVAIFGMDLGNVIAFTTIMETIFAWPGMGELLIDAINKSDRPITVVYLMAIAYMFVVLNFVVDLLYTLIDPRIELG